MNDYEQNMMTYLGVDMRTWKLIKEFWIGQPERIEKQALLDEIVTLRGKLSFYESRIKAMYQEIGKS
jgi:hypothetical protein